MQWPGGHRKTRLSFQEPEGASENERRKRASDQDAALMGCLQVGDDSELLIALTAFEPFAFCK